MTTKQIRNRLSPSVAGRPQPQNRESMPRERTLASFIDSRPLGSLRVRIFGVCFLIVLMDGFDTQAIGFAAKAMSGSLGIALDLFGSVFSAGLFGAMLGALCLGPLGDRSGRRWMLAACIVAFAACSVLTALAHGLPDLLAFRFLAGLGLGGAIPNVLALASEYSPRPMRALFTGLLYAGFPLGGALGAIVSARVIPTFGWQALFYIGGIIPVALAVLVSTSLPESLQFLLRRPNGQYDVRSVLRRMSPKAEIENLKYVDDEEQVEGLPIASLLTNGRAKRTLLLWLAFFMCFVLLIVLVLWTPALLRESGIGERQAAMVVGLINLGSVLGTALGGRLIDRFGVSRVMPALFAAGAVTVSLIGEAGSTPMLSICAALSGFFVGAGSSGLLGLAVLAYPSAMRATGVGWAMAMGRFGQVVGPLLVGALLANAATIPSIFLWCAAPAACAAIVSFLIGRLKRGDPSKEFAGGCHDDAAQCPAAEDLQVPPGRNSTSLSEPTGATGVPI
jgi:AAHS family 4-hydroxybenzoate transporter-like MFS transporter